MNKSINSLAAFSLVSTSMVYAQTAPSLPAPAVLSAEVEESAVSKLWTNVRSRSWSNPWAKTETPENYTAGSSLPKPSTTPYIDEVQRFDGVDYSPNFLLTETSVGESWIRLDYRHAFGGSDDLVYGSQFDQSNIILRGEYAISKALAFTGEYGYQDLGSPVDQIFDSGTTSPKIGVKFDIIDRADYTGTFYFSRLLNESANARYSEMKENGVEFGFTNTYVIPSKKLTLVLDLSVAIMEYQETEFSNIEDLKEVEVNFGAYKELTDRWGLGLEVGYYDFDGAGFPGVTTLVRSNIFANYSFSDKLDVTAGYNLNGGNTEGYTGTVKQQISLGATYSF